MASYDYPATAASAQPNKQPKPISNAYDVSYIPQPLRPGSLMGARHSNDSSARRNHQQVVHTEEYRNDGTGVRHQPATICNSSYESTSPYAHSQSATAYSSIFNAVQSQSTQRFPLPPQPTTCELNQWITTTTTNSPVQQLQHLNQQQQQQHYTSAQTQYAGQPGSMSSASSSFPSTTSPTSASDSYDYASSASPDIYNSPAYQHLTYHSTAPSSLPVSSVLNADSVGTGWPSSAPATSSGMDLYTQMMLNFQPQHSPPHHHSSSLSNVASSPLESSNFYTGFAGLGLQSQTSPRLPQQHDENTGVSPRDVMSSTTVVDADDFGTSWGSGNSPMGDFPVVNGAGGAGMSFSPEYTRYAFSAGAEDLDLSGSFAARNNSSGAGQMMATATATYQDAFGSSSSPSDFNGHDHQDQVQQTQFPLDLEENMEASMATLRALPTNNDANANTRATGGGRLGLQLLDTHGHGHGTRHRDDTVTARSVAGLWDGPASAPVESAMHQHFGRRQMVGDRRPSLHAAFSDILPKSESPILSSVPFVVGGEEVDAEEDDEEEEEDDDADDDDDYVEERSLSHHQHHSNASGQRMSIRRHSHNVPRPTKPSKRSSPYSRPRPSNTSSTTTSSTSRGTADKKSNGEKKIKAVKWESTKPKYWVPEGFDPWWDQKSRGRGVETISSSLSSSYDQDDVVVGERDYLPDDWRELVRGQGNPARPFVCPAVNCGKTFQRSEHAKRHAGSLHTPDAGCEHKSTRGDNLKQHMDSHRRKKGGAGSFSASGLDADDKDRTVRSRKGSAVGAAANRPRRVRSMAAVKNEDE